MPQQISEYKCLLISPGDVTAERDALTDMAQSWNAHIGKHLNVRVDLVRWESHGTPDMSQPAQAALNEQLLDDCELAIAVFWTRVGTATQDYESGSVEEIERLLKRGVRVLIYFCERDIPQATLTDDQFQRLQKLRQNYTTRGLVWKYSQIQNLREQVNLHLSTIITGMLSQARADDSVNYGFGKLTAAIPDVRVSVSGGVSVTPGGAPLNLMIISVENHSPIKVYLSNIVIELDRSENLFIKQDFLTGDFNTHRELDPGQSMSFRIGPNQLWKFRDRTFKYAVAVDEIGRRYQSSDDGGVQRLVGSLLGESDGQKNAD
jgi:hypothetical protein